MSARAAFARRAYRIPLYTLDESRPSLRRAHRERSERLKNGKEEPRETFEKVSHFQTFTYQTCGLRPVNTQNIRKQPCRQPRCSREAWRDRISSEKLWGCDLVYALRETLRLPTMDFFAHRICDSCDRLARSLHFSPRSAGRLFQISSRVANARTGQRRRLECGGFQRTAVDQKQARRGNRAGADQVACRLRRFVSRFRLARIRTHLRSWIRVHRRGAQGVPILSEYLICSQFRQHIII